MRWVLTQQTNQNADTCLNYPEFWNTGVLIIMSYLLPVPLDVNKAWKKKRTKENTLMWSVYSHLNTIHETTEVKALH